MIRRVSVLFAVVVTSLLQISPGLAQASAGLATGEALVPAAASTEHDGPAARSPAAVTPRERFEGAEVFGVSGALRVVVLPNDLPVSPAVVAATGVGTRRPRWVPIHGTTRDDVLGEPVYHGEVFAPATAGMWRLEVQEDDSVRAPTRPLVLITTVPFAAKQDGRLNGYHIGTYPAEGAIAKDEYAPPSFFIEVTPENQDVQVSEHFRLRQFLTKDQFDVWPKYLALNLRLIDKLELVIQELNTMGVRALEMHVMSGFRTPQYNGPGGDGRATLSRHMYGDAADVWVDGDGDGMIDDLNGDARSDIRDAELLLRAVERVEQKYPDLTGGAGLYESNDSHGPFVHVDVRGNRARW